MTSTQPTLHRDRLIRLTLLMSLIAVAVVIAMNRTRSHPTAANTIQTAVGSELPPTTTAPTNDVDIEWGILAIAASEPAAEGCEAHYQASQNIVVHGDAYAPGTAIQISFDSNATDEQLLTTTNPDATGSFQTDVLIPAAATPQLGQGVQAVGAGTGGQVRVAYGELIIDPPGPPCTSAPTDTRLTTTA